MPSPPSDPAWIRDDLTVTDEALASISEMLGVLDDPRRADLHGGLREIAAGNPQPPVPVPTVLSVDGDGAAYVRFDWTKTVHNGTYLLSRLTEAGVWARIGAVASSAAQPSFDLATPLPVTSEDGDPIYHRFKIDVQNSSGLLNRREAPITVNLADL